MEQFLLEKWLQDKSHKVVTRTGKPVRIVCWDSPNKTFPIVGFVDNEEKIFVWDCFGYCREGHIESDVDLFFADAKENLSEDERIRKALLEYFGEQCDMSNWNGVYGYEIYAWLEKQGEKNHTDKVEPKFKVGDWIVNNNGEPRVFRVEKKGWPDSIISSSLGNQFINTFTLDKQYHLWTIQDAKEGDVLYHKSPWTGIEYIVMSRGVNDCGSIDSYFRYNSGDGFGIDIPSVLSAKLDDITPANKEQRDLLFQKMKEAGYEWDAEKKELKNIEQKPAWSNEDEKFLNYAISLTDDAQIKNFLKSLKDRVQQQPQQEWNEEDERICQCLIKDQEKSLDDVRNDKYGHSEIISDLKEMYRERIDWLKSIKPNHWKPSEEQMEALQVAIRNATTPEYADELEYLYKNLQKL